MRDLLQRQRKQKYVRKHHSNKMYKGAREEKENAGEMNEIHHILLKYLSNTCNHVNNFFFRKILGSILLHSFHQNMLVLTNS